MKEAPKKFILEIGGRLRERDWHFIYWVDIFLCSRQADQPRDIVGVDGEDSWRDDMEKEGRCKVLCSRLRTQHVQRLRGGREPGTFWKPE